MSDSNSNAGFSASLAGLWALLWRSVVLLPAMAAIFAVWCYAWMGLVGLPFAVGICLWDGDWQYALLCMALWPVCLVCARWFWRRERTEPGGQGWL